MSDTRIEATFDLARQQLAVGNVGGAVEALRRTLAEDPDFAPGHALLAICLLGQRRVHAAELEAGLALTLDPERAASVYVMGQVRLTQRRLKEANQYFEQAIAMDPTVPGFYCSKARLSVIERRRDDARALLRRALELDPEDPDVLVQLGELELSENRTEEAVRLAREALEIQPEHVDGLVLMGHIHLLRGDGAAAREHALWALRLNAEDSDAIRLLAEIKARRSWFLGLWWRWNSWMGRHGENSQILLLLGAYMVYRITRQVAADAHNPQLGDMLSLVWLGLCIYSWFGPAIFRRSIERELQPVKLEKDF